MSKSDIRRGPDFIVIGSMKAGTTTLHEELSKHPYIYMSSWKEPGYFVGPDFGGPEKAPLPLARSDEYFRLFMKARGDQLCGESSTYYTKLPDLHGAAQNIYNELGGSVKFIFVVREPAARALSHYGHAYQHKECGVAPFSRAVDEYASLVDYSRYGMQIAPYLALYPRENVLVIKFENLVANKRLYLEKCLNFLGVSPDDLPEVDAESSRNSADDRREWAGWARKLRWSPFFQARIEPLIPKRFLVFMKKFVTKEPASVPYGEDVNAGKEKVLSMLSVDDLAVYESAE